MIIVLTGPTCSGKTTTGFELLKIFNNMVLLDCDWFCAMQPFSWNKKSDVLMIYQAIALMIEFHQKNGKNRFVITMTSQMATALHEFQLILNPSKMPVRAFRLRCSDTELINRINLCHQTNKKQEEINAVNQQRFFDTNFKANIPYMLVDVNNLNEQEVVRKIRTMINEYEKLQKSHVDISQKIK